jgi:deoxyribodipyrimidine photo-lyase
MNDSVAIQSIATRPAVPARQAALARLDAFLEALPGYASGRGHDIPDQQQVSGLSPFIRHRILTEREAAAAVLSRYDYAVAAPFIEQLGWRTYWKGYLELRPAIWDRYLEQLAAVGAGPETDLPARLDAARGGRTGIACFDAWAQQLVDAGWLHNHARMWFASIWIFTLRLPWQAGAAFFLEHLLDGDPASNTLSWRWVAGLHTPGKHYLARAENIRRHTGGRFDPAGQLDESAACLPADGPFPAQLLPPVDALRDVQFPSLSSCPAGLLVTPEDLSPESGELAETPFSSICVLSASDRLDTAAASARVRAFHDSAVADAARRLAQHWDGTVVACRGTIIPMVGKACPANVGRRERMRVYGGAVDNWVDSVLVWARNEHLKSVWMLRPPVGPWADALPALETALRGRDVRLFTYRRRWDASHWPHATAGYFPFREGLRGRIERLEGAALPAPRAGFRGSGGTGLYR